MSRLVLSGAFFSLAGFMDIVVQCDAGSSTDLACNAVARKLQVCRARAGYRSHNIELRFFFFTNHQCRYEISGIRR